MEKNVDKMVARYLLDIKAVRLSPEKPFIWASGWHSPIYCDNRKILSSVEIRNFVCDSMCALIKEHYPTVETIAGVATGAIAMGMLVADRLGLPFVYVRPKPKDHGTGVQVEGELKQGSKTVVIEDLVSTGGSALGVLNALRVAGARLLGMTAIFSYNFDVARENFENANCELYTLSNYEALLEAAVETNYIKPENLEILKQWRYMPDKWGR